MSKAQFPTRRFRGIGASAEEVAEMVRAFENSDIVVQSDVVDHLKSLSASALRGYLASWREVRKALGEEDPDADGPDAPEPASPESAPGGFLGEDTDEDLPGPSED